jgi:hypothetical protein
MKICCLFNVVTHVFLQDKASKKWCVQCRHNLKQREFKKKYGTGTGTGYNILKTLFHWKLHSLCSIDKLCYYGYVNVGSYGNMLTFCIFSQTSIDPGELYSFWLFHKIILTNNIIKCSKYVNHVIKHNICQ